MLWPATRLPPKKAAGITGSLPAKTVQPSQRPTAHRSAPPARRPTAVSCGRRSIGYSAGHPGPARSNSKPTARPPPATVSPDSPTYPAPPAHRQRLPRRRHLRAAHRVTRRGAAKRSRRSLDRCDTMRRPAAGVSAARPRLFLCGSFIGHGLYEQSPAVFFDHHLITTMIAKVLKPPSLQPDKRPPVFPIEVCIIDSQDT